MSKTYYLFDSVTGEFKGTYDAQESPLEPGQFISPIDSTDISIPTTTAGQVAVFLSGSWTIEPDHRGETWYDQTIGEPTEITTIGQPAANLKSTLPDARLLSDAQSSQIKLINESYTELVEAPISYLGTTFQADAGSQALIATVLTASGGTLPSGFTWYDQSNAAIPVNYTQLLGLAQAILTRGQPLFIHRQVKKAAIREASTVEAVKSIVW